jgi:hypothetical protein
MGKRAKEENRKTTTSKDKQWASWIGAKTITSYKCTHVYRCVRVCVCLPLV